MLNLFHLLICQRFLLLHPFLNNQPNYGASIFITTIDHDFIYNDYVLTAPHPVNGYGIPFSIGDTIEVELHDIIPPVINIEGVSDNGNPGIIDPDESFIIFSSESLLRNGEAITGDSLDSYITAKYVSDDTPIVCTIFDARVTKYYIYTINII